MAVVHSATFEGRTDGAGRKPQLNFEIPDALLAEVDFKWLMAGHGWHVDMVRFGEDLVYTARLLDWAMRSNSQALRACADALQGHFDRHA